MDLTNDDVADILALLDSLPYDELDLQTPRFRLTLRRTPGGWTQSTQVLSAPDPLAVNAADGAAGAGEAVSGGRAAAPGAQAAVPGAQDAAPGAQDAAPTAQATATTAQDAAPTAQATATMSHRRGPDRDDVTSSRSGGRAEAAGREADGAEETDGAAGEAGPAAGLVAGPAAGLVAGPTAELVAVRAPLPGTFYRAPRPGAAPFVEVGSRVDADTVIGIVETMKLMNSVHAGVAGEVAEFCVANAEFAERGAPLLRIRSDR
jgi:acetyl-CoA carboxylase biotin carboxyl carrier protein